MCSVHVHVHCPLAVHKYLCIRIKPVLCPKPNLLYTPVLVPVHVHAYTVHVHKQRTHPMYSTCTMYRHCRGNTWHAMYTTSFVDLSEGDRIGHNFSLTPRTGKNSLSLIKGDLSRLISVVSETNMLFTFCLFIVCVLYICLDHDDGQSFCIYRAKICLKVFRCVVIVQMLILMS